MTHVLFSLDSAPAQFPGMDFLASEVFYLMGCRTFNQFCCTLRALLRPRQFCPFCENELERRARKPHATFGRWMLLSNEFPHKSTAQMWLIVPQRHVTHPDELDEQDWIDIGRTFTECREHVPDGGVMFRFGNPRRNVGTIEHLHVNVVEPICGREYRPPFAKDYAELIQDYQRMLGFRNELNQVGNSSWLFSPEGIAITQPPVG